MLQAPPRSGTLRLEAPSLPAVRMGIGLLGRLTAALLRLLSVVLAVVALAIVAVALLVYSVFNIVSPPAFAVDFPANAGAQYDLTVPFRVAGPGSEIAGVSLVERVVDGAGATVSQREVPVAIELLSTRTWPWKSEYRLVSPNGASLLRNNARYELVVAANLLQLSTNGFLVQPVTRTYRFATVDTPTPNLSAEPVTLAPGREIPIQWSQPMESLWYEIVPPAPSTLERQDAEGRQWAVRLHGYEQDRTYQVRILEARAANGTTYDAPFAISAIAPPGISVESITPEDGDTWVKLDSRPVVTFSGPVAEADRPAAERAITIEPSVPGEFVWEAPNQVAFQAAEGLPPSEKVTIRVQSGPEVRAASGGYLADGAAVSFTTRTNKRIDIDLSKQMLHLIEGEKVVYSTIMSSGILNTTPAGTFVISYKVRMTDMRGTNPGSGTPYLVKDVPWVLPFLGDYCIHGVYWRDVWGRPASAGCVGLPVPIAEKVYNWTPIGTVVTIHY
ncbi:MAG: L,D-transpeptidase family protein [Chloroflexi bacterium]|nr:L,D-transpeptidase family protein [Chloroflexota bacterium]